MKKNKNKGFTLVELIIVVAIIAVLAAVLAPQYMRYVERSNQSNDLQVATNYMKAATIALTDLTVGGHTSSYEWFVFKWGYSTGNNDNLNAHMGRALVDANGRPTGIDNNGRDPALQQEVAAVMGWEWGTNDIVPESIARPQSAAAAEVPHGQNSFIFYISNRTGEILVDQSSANWVNEIGVNATLMS